MLSRTFISEPAEFKKGDLVTFHAFEREQVPAKVVEYLGVETTTGLHKYRLEGNGKPLLTITTGRSIRESKHFVEPKEFIW